MSKENKEILAKQHAAAQEAKEKKQLAVQKHEEELAQTRKNQKDETPQNLEESVVVKKEAVNDDYWKKIVADYTEQYKKEPEKENELVFSSDEEAENFFTKQATMNREFLVQKFVDNEPTGFFMYSCGDGKCYKGNIQAIQKELQTALESNPDKSDLYTKALATIQKFMPASNATNSMRGMLDEIKKPEKSEPSPDASLNTSNTPTPNPFK